MMTQPPRGSKMMPNKALDARDAEILARLAADERCQDQHAHLPGHRGQVQAPRDGVARRADSERR